MTNKRIFIKSVFFCLAFGALTLLPLFAAAHEMASIKDSFLYGLCMHLGSNRKVAYTSAGDVQIKLMQQGVTSARDDLSWDIRQATSLQTIPPSMSKIGQSLIDKELRHILILRGNSQEIPEIQPQSEASRKIYVDYAKKAAFALKEINPIFEIWNEWNNAARKDPNLGKAEDYVDLAKATYPEIKKIIPNGIVLAGAVGSDGNWLWTLKAVQLGLLDYADGLSIHLYNHCEKVRTAREIIARLKFLHSSLTKIAPNKDIPIYITEMGWPDVDGKCGGISEQDVSDNAAQVLLELPSFPWLKGVWFYELIDSGASPDDSEHHYGMYKLNGTLKPVGCATRTVWDFIKEAKEPQISYPIPNVTMAVYKAKNKMLRVALWKRDEQKETRTVLLPQEAKSTPFCGGPLAKHAIKNEIGNTPFLIEMPEASLPLLKFE